MNHDLISPYVGITQIRFRVKASSLLSACFIRKLPFYHILFSAVPESGAALPFRENYCCFVQKSCYHVWLENAIAA